MVRTVCKTLLAWYSILPVFLAAENAWMSPVQCDIKRKHKIDVSDNERMHVVEKRRLSRIVLAGSISRDTPTAMSRRTHTSFELVL